MIFKCKNWLPSNLGVVYLNLLVKSLINFINPSLSNTPIGSKYFFKRSTYY